MCVRSSFPRLNDKFLFIFQLLKDIFQRLASLYPIPSRSRTCDTSLCFVPLSFDNSDCNLGLVVQRFFDEFIES